MTYLHIFLHLFLLVSELAKSINDQTWEGQGASQSPTSDPAPATHL